MPFGIGFGEMILIFAVLLLVFGAKRLPEIGGAMGKSIRDFKQAISGMDGEPTRPSLPEQSAPPPQASPPPPAPSLAERRGEEARREETRREEPHSEEPRRDEPRRDELPG